MFLKAQRYFHHYDLMISVSALINKLKFLAVLQLYIPEKYDAGM